MKVLEAIFDALRSLRSNTLRSVLTTLGIIIGVCSVIIMVAVGNGARARVDEVIQSMGSNLMMVVPGSHMGGGARSGAGSLPSLTTEDSEAIQKEIPSVLAAAPSVSGSVQVIAGNLNWSTQATGVTSEYLTAREWRVSKGRAFTDDELKSSTKVALLGKTVADNMFPNQDPVGQSVRLNRVPVTVIGVLEAKGQGPPGRDQDDVILIPLPTAKKRVLGGRDLGGKVVDVIAVKARSSELITQTEEQVKSLLRQRHNIAAGKDDDFRVHNLAEMMKAQANSSQTMSLLLMAVASVSLIVGGIGIMNIMLVSVTERTKEIGLRMSVGATGADIMIQFLVEAVVLSFIGGLLGASLGIGGSLIIASVGAMAGRHRREIGAFVLCLFRSGGHVFRVLSGAQGIPPGPHRGPALRITQNRAGPERNRAPAVPAKNILMGIAVKAPRAARPPPPRRFISCTFYNRPSRR